MRIAALDLGSNSFHLLVADVHPDGTFAFVAREKAMLRLGDEVSRHGSIGPAAADRAVATVRRLAQLAESYGARDFMAKATSAIRSAPNGSALVDRIEEEVGVHVEVIDGLEEARLIFSAVRASVVLDPPPALCFDLGGGSVEIMVGDTSRLLWATSEPLGVGRLTAETACADPPTKSDRRRLESRIASALTPIAKTVRRYSPGIVIGSSGTLDDLAVMTVARRTGDVPATSNGLRIARDEFLALHQELVRSTVAERRRVPGLEESRAELIVAGSTFLAVAMEMFGFDEMTVSDWALREGIVLDAMRTHDPDDWSDDPHAIRRAAVAGLARRCNSDIVHTRHVADLACSLFDQTAELHGLGPVDRDLLEYATLLHDIGQHVSRKGHHRHAAYLVQHGDLRGFAPDEIAALTALVRHHRRGDPKVTEPRFEALPEADRERVRALAAIIRVADGLDRGRRSRVDAVDVAVGPDLVIVHVHTCDGTEPELELWGARRRRDLFERVFGRELEFLPVPAEPEPAS